MKTPFIYINGSIKDEKKASVSVLDRGLLFGDGLFETMRAVGLKTAFLPLHMKRLKDGLRALGFGPGVFRRIDSEIKKGIIEELLKKNNLAEKTSRVRITITRGEDVRLKPSRSTPPTVIITASAIDEEAVERKRKKGISAATVKGPLPALPGVKTTNLLPHILALSKAGRRAECLFVERDGTVTEGATSNLFVVKDGAVSTAPASVPHGPALPGITRSVVIEIANERGLSVMIEKIGLDALYDADEAFLTNAVTGVVPLVRVDSVKIGRPGPITRLFQRFHIEKSLESVGCKAGPCGKGRP